jgi:hypothetical protein
MRRWRDTRFVVLMRWRCSLANLFTERTFADERASNCAPLSITIYVHRYWILWSYTLARGGFGIGKLISFHGSSTRGYVAFERNGCDVDDSINSRARPHFCVVAIVGVYNNIYSYIFTVHINVNYVRITSGHLYLFFNFFFFFFVEFHQDYFAGRLFRIANIIRNLLGF